MNPDPCTTPAFATRRHASLCLLGAMLPGLGGTAMAQPAAAAGAGVAPSPATRAFDLQAHRGGRALAPENTLNAFLQAIDLGVTTLELDIGLTADDVVVISHDLALNPDHTRDADGRFLAARGPLLRKMTLAQLQAYDVGRLNPDTPYGRQFARQVPHDGERIPTLAALFDAVKARGADTVRFNIEIKSDPTRPQDSAPTQQMTQALLADIERAGMTGRVTIQSFDWSTLAQVAEAAPHMPRAYLSSSRTLRDSRWTLGLSAAGHGSTPQLVKAAAGEGPAPLTWSPSFNGLTAAQVREAQALGLTVVVWTVNERTGMQRLIDWGVDGLITDDPALLREVMQARGMALPPAGGGAGSAVR